MSTVQKQEAEPSVVAEMVRSIVIALVDHPEEVFIRETVGSHSGVIEIDVARDDIGKVIGTHGVHADAIRKLVTAAGGKLKRRYMVEIIE